MSDDQAAGTPFPHAGSEAAAAVAGVDPVAAGSENALPAIPGRRYTSRFAIAYTGLGMILVAALTGLVLLVIRPGHQAGPSWSPWKPSSGPTQKVTNAIAEYIAPRYRLSESGGQLVALIASKPQITSGTSNVQIKYIAVRRVPSSNTGIAIYPAAKLVNYTLCGLGQNCSIATGTPSEQRGRLVRREALEAALYTFKFADGVDSVAAFMPPAPGQTATQLLFMRKADFGEQLKQPLSKTLPLTTPPLPTSADRTEAAAIDKLTEPRLYTYGLQALQTGGAVLILDPAT